MERYETDAPISAEAIPHLCEGVEILNLEITPEEGFIISRIDGILNVKALLQSTGLGEKKAMELLGSLQSKGLLIFHDPNRPSIDQNPKPPEETETADAQIYDLATLLKLLKKPLPKGDELIPLIESIFVNLENLSYYELLNVRPRDDEGRIKKAYLFRSMSFHPDRFYRRGDDRFKFKLQEIFKQVNKGYQVLSHPESKAEYDGFLDEEMGAEAEQETEEIMAGPRPRFVSRARAVKGEAARSGRPLRKLKKTGLNEDAKIKLGLKGEKTPSSPMFKQIQRIRNTVGDPRAEQAKKFYDGAIKEIDRGNLKGAKTNLKLALQYDPKNKKLQAALADLDKHEEGQRAEEEFKAGQSAQMAGELREAMLHYREAMNLGYQNARLFHRMAELSIELDGNYDRARSLSLKALEMEPGRPEYHLTLARAYKGLGQKPTAAAQYEKALSLDPKNKIAAKELKALKKG